MIEQREMWSKVAKTKGIHRERKYKEAYSPFKDLRFQLTWVIYKLLQIHPLAGIISFFTEMFGQFSLIKLKQLEIITESIKTFIITKTVRL